VLASGYLVRRVNIKAMNAFLRDKGILGEHPWYHSAIPRFQETVRKEFDFPISQGISAGHSLRSV
jgi:radical SAM superfamily enzyme with C-terminal helix-hairpin-helix motif